MIKAIAVLNFNKQENGDRAAFVSGVCVWEIIGIYDLLWGEGTF
jgi:hypothetical protein